MKKITLLFITMLALSFASYGQVNYSIELKDSFSDGWKDSSTDVLINGSVVLDDITIPYQIEPSDPGGDTLTFPFSVSDCDVITVVTTVGSNEDFPEEMSYIVRNDLSAIVGVGSGNMGSQTFNDTEAINADCSVCDFPVATFELVSNCPTDSGFSINVTVTDIGTASGVVISDDQGTAASGVLGTGTHNYGSYTQGDAVIITVTNADSSICYTDSSLLTSVNACPPSNDDCGAALLLTPSADSSPAFTTSTTLGNTASGEVADVSCTNAYNFGAGRDTWFRVEVPISEELTIETKAASGSNLTDTIISVYSGSCGSLTEIGCDDDGGNGLFSKVSLSSADGIAANEYLLVRVYRYHNDVNDDLTEDGEFQIAAYAADPTLSVETIKDQVALSYFPNPVKDKLTLKAQQNIQNVSVYNMLGQEVMRTRMDVQRGDLDMSSLQSGPYFVKVDINGNVETLRIIKK